jgi:hypothetical protein
MHFLHWKAHFELNRSHFDSIDWAMDDDLTAKEKKLIFASLQQFQKGENSEGKHLYSFAKKWGDATYIECIRLFIKEEQKHALVLGRYMDIYSIPRIKNHWVDGVFRGLRKMAGLENTITVLLTAEIISKVYYKGLKNATGSALLAKLCNQVLKDEDQHIAFQCCTLSMLYRNKGKLARLFHNSWHVLLMLGTIVVVWMHHRRVLKAGGYSFFNFLLETLLVFVEAGKEIKGSSQLKLA